MNAILHALSAGMPPTMLLWFLAGFLFLLRDRGLLARDEKGLGALKDIAREAQGSDYETKMSIRMALVEWADQHPAYSLSRWIYTVHNAVYSGGQGDITALSDAIWSQEQERHYWFRFFQKNAILLGLFFTSVGLCDTLSQIAPVLLEKATDQNQWIQGVQAAMAHALGGMSAAFTSSLAGLFSSLALAFLSNLILHGRHERYLNRLDAFLQGNLVPVFSSIVEKDRNDLIREMLSRTEEAFQDIKVEFRNLASQNQLQYEDLSGLKKSLSQSVRRLDGQLAAFGKGVEVFSSAGDSLTKAIRGIDRAIEEGLGQVSDTHGQGMRLQQRFQEEVMSPFTTQVAEQINLNAETSKRALRELSLLGYDLRKLSGVLGEGWEERQERFEGLQEKLSAAIEHQADAASVQGDLLSQTAREQAETLAKITHLVDAFSVDGEKIQEQLSGLYGLHQQELSKLYQSFASSFGKVLLSSVESPRYFSEGLPRALQGKEEEELEESEVS